MKLKLLLPLLSLGIAVLSCSPEPVETNEQAVTAGLVNEYSYNESEVELTAEINDYRTSIGLGALKTVNHVSFKSEEHNAYMIANKVVNHDLFEQRSQNIIQVLNAVKVNENIAYNYTTAAGALNAWLNSPGHKANIEGDFTHFGVSVTEDPETGKKYYTNIFIKIN